MDVFLRDLRNRRKNLRRVSPPLQPEHKVSQRALPTLAVQRALQDPNSLQASDLLELQRVIGNRAVAGLLSARSSSQTSRQPSQSTSGLSVGPSKDGYERAAHQVAGEVSHS